MNNVIEIKPISFEKSKIELYCNSFNIYKKFKELYVIKDIGISISKEFKSQNFFLIELVDKEKNNILVPTKFFYDFLDKYSFNDQKLTLKNQKWLDEFLYNKDLPIKHAFKEENIEKNTYYLLYFENQIVGIIKSDDKIHFAYNLENISSYLFES